MSATDSGEEMVLMTWPGNTRLVGTTESTGRFAMPEALNVTNCGFPIALSDIVSVPFNGPSAVGEAVMNASQLALWTNIAGQSFVTLNPTVTVMLLMVTGSIFVLLRITACSLLVVPTSWPGKTRFIGFMESCGKMPCPVKFTA